MASSIKGEIALLERQYAIMNTKLNALNDAYVSKQDVQMEREGSAVRQVIDTLEGLLVYDLTNPKIGIKTLIGAMRAYPNEFKYGYKGHKKLQLTDYEFTKITDRLQQAFPSTSMDGDLEEFAADVEYYKRSFHVTVDTSTENIEQLALRCVGAQSVMTAMMIRAVRNLTLPGDEMYVDPRSIE